MTIESTNTSESSGLLLAVDQTKAFDTVSWSLIHHALDFFGFGEQLSSAVEVLFRDIKTCNFNSGFSSGYFLPSRGIRQGCCCSPSIFILTVELLALMVRQSLAGQQVKISQYADDATIFFLRDFESLAAPVTYRLKERWFSSTF